MDSHLYDNSGGRSVADLKRMSLKTDKQHYDYWHPGNISGVYPLYINIFQTYFGSNFGRQMGIQFSLVFKDSVALTRLKRR